MSIAQLSAHRHFAATLDKNSVGQTVKGSGEASGIMTKDDCASAIEALIKLIHKVKRRPRLYFGGDTVQPQQVERAMEWLHVGYWHSVFADQGTRHWEAVRLRGWEMRPEGPIPSMVEKGLSNDEIIAEIFEIELLGWDLLLKKLRGMTADEYLTAVEAAKKGVVATKTPVMPISQFALIDTTLDEASRVALEPIPSDQSFALNPSCVRIRALSPSAEAIVSICRSDQPDLTVYDRIIIAPFFLQSGLYDLAVPNAKWASDLLLSDSGHYKLTCGQVLRPSTEINKPPKLIVDFYLEKVNEPLSAGTVLDIKTYPTELTDSYKS